MPAEAAFDLERFVTAQAPVFATALAELQSGQKRSHWMWFIFPQLRGLGRSTMAQHYGVGSLTEARAYLAHPLLGPRLVQCTLRRAGNRGPAAARHIRLAGRREVPLLHDLVLARARGGCDVFRQALDRFCGGRADERTLALLGGERA